MRIGIEVGGTFTDLVAIDGDGIRVLKVPSTPHSPDVGAFAALEASGVPLDQVVDLAHGSTVATNAVLERKGFLTAFITTRGFRDILQLQRHGRTRVYDLHYCKPVPVVKRSATFEVGERMLSTGQVLMPLHDDEIAQDLVPRLRDGGFRAVAICLLNAYVNPAHERQLRQVLLQHLPELSVTISSDITREFRDGVVGLRAARDGRLHRALRAAPGRGGLSRPLQRHAVQRRAPAGRGDEFQRHHGTAFRPSGRRHWRGSAGSALGLYQPDHLGHRRHVLGRVRCRRRAAAADQ
jgi:N-methylhydantoinase A